MRFFRFIMFPFSWIYGAAVLLRNWSFEAGVFRVKDHKVPVVSVGNISTGGTGKTPMVEYLVRFYAGLGMKVAVISRGYGRRTRGIRIVSDGSNLKMSEADSGDEPFQLAKKYPGLIVVVGENRSSAAEITVESFNPGVILLDDAFQHRWIGRRLDIVMVAGQRVFSKIPLLPAGAGREPVSCLGRADLIAVSGDHSPEMLRHLKKYCKGALINVRLKVKNVVRYATGEKLHGSEVAGLSCLAFSGIGNPQSFRSTLRETGLIISDYVTFPDHFRFSARDFERIRSRFENCGARIIVTTEKDAVRLSAGMTDEFPLSQLYFLAVELEVVSGVQTLREMLTEAVRKAA